MTSEKARHSARAAGEVPRVSVVGRLQKWFRRVAAVMDDREAVVAFFKSLR
jgi:hypothetical protein